MGELVQEPSGDQSSLALESDFNVDTSAVVEEGRNSLSQLGKTWVHWETVIKALSKGRVDCMRLAHTNKPVGSLYNSLFGRWMDINGFASLKDWERRDCFRCVDHLAVLTQYWISLPEDEQRRCNHPKTIFHKWKQSQGETKTASKKNSVSLKDAVIRLQAENDDLRRRNGEGQISSDDSANSIGYWMLRTISEHKFDRIVRVYKEGLAKKKANGQNKPPVLFGGGNV